MHASHFFEFRGRCAHAIRACLMFIACKIDNEANGSCAAPSRPILAQNACERRCFACTLTLAKVSPTKRSPLQCNNRNWEKDGLATTRPCSACREHRRHGRWRRYRRSPAIATAVMRRLTVSVLCLKKASFGAQLVLRPSEIKTRS